MEPNAFGAMLQKSGAVGLNASTSHDATKYFMSLPANMLELWFALEAERFQVRPSMLSHVMDSQLYLAKLASRCSIGHPSLSYCRWHDMHRVCSAMNGQLLGGKQAATQRACEHACHAN